MVSPQQLTVTEGASKFMSSMEVVTVDRLMVPMVWSWHMVVEITVATADSADSSCDALVGGQSTSILADLPAVRDLAISWNPGGSTFSLAPRSSSSQGASSQELPDEAELKGPLRACWSSSWRWWALFCQLELWLQWHHLRSPGLLGILPTKATIPENVLWPILGIPVLSDSLHLQLFLKGWEDQPALPLIQQRWWQGQQNSSSNVAGVVIRAADTFSDPEGAMVKTAQSSTSEGSVALGWVVSSTSTPGNPYIRSSKTSWSLKVVYLFICHLNSCMHIAKWWGSLGTGE